MRNQGRSKDLCFDCHLAKIMRIATAMHRKRGPVWEDAIRRNLKHWHAEAERAGLPPDCYTRA